MTAPAVPTNPVAPQPGIRPGPLAAALLLLAGVIGVGAWWTYTNVTISSRDMTQYVEQRDIETRVRAEIMDPGAVQRGRINFRNNAIEIRLPQVTITARADNSWKPEGYYDSMAFVPSFVREALNAARTARDNANAAANAKVTPDQIEKLKNVHAPVDTVDAPETAKARLAAAIASYVAATGDARTNLQRPLLEAAQAYAAAGLAPTFDQDLAAADQVAGILNQQQMTELGGGRGGFGFFGPGNGGARNRNFGTGNGNNGPNNVAPNTGAPNGNNAGGNNNQGTWRRNNNNANRTNVNPGNNLRTNPEPTSPATSPAAAPVQN